MAIKMVYNKKLLDYFKEKSKKITKDKLSHVMKNNDNFILYYYRSKENGGNYTIKLPIYSISKENIEKG